MTNQCINYTGINRTRVHISKGRKVLTNIPPLFCHDCSLFSSFCSYTTLPILQYSNRIGKTQEAHHRVEQEGISFHEAEWMVELDLFLDEYPRWDLGTPHRLVILHEMFLHATAKGWQEAECMWHQGCWESVKEPDPKAGQSSLELIGYHTSWVEVRDVYHSVYLLNRALGFPSCGAAQRRMAIQEILSSLQERLQRQVPPDGTGDLPIKARG